MFHRIGRRYLYLTLVDCRQLKTEIRWQPNYEIHKFRNVPENEMKMLFIISLSVKDGLENIFCLFLLFVLSIIIPKWVYH